MSHGSDDRLPSSSGPKRPRLEDNDGAVSADCLTLLPQHITEKQAVSKCREWPWMISGKFYSTGVMGLHEEIEDFFDYVSPRIADHNARLEVVARITDVVKELWPHSVINLFGSFRTGLYNPTSDVDLVIIGNWNALPLRTLEDAIRKSLIADPDSLKVISGARVPLIKMTDRASGVNVDISFNTNNGIKSVELINSFKRKYPALPRLVMVIKQFVSQRNFNETSAGGVSSYSLVLMVVSFFQQHPRHDAGQLSSNLGVLLIEFFELYGKNFPYWSKTIRIRDGGAHVPKNDNTLKMPLQPGKGNQPGKRPILSIEDPLNPMMDLGRGSFRALGLKSAFEFGFMTLTQAVHPLKENLKDPNVHSILGRIIRIEDDGSTNPRRAIGSRRSNPVPSEPLSASAAGHIGTPPKVEETQERRE